MQACGRIKAVDFWVNNNFLNRHSRVGGNPVKPQFVVSDLGSLSFVFGSVVCFYID